MGVGAIARAVALACALAACAPTVEPAPMPVVYAAPASPWPAPPVTARLGGGAARTAPIGLPIVAATSAVATPLTSIALIDRRDGAAEAALSGRDERGPAIDLIDIDAGVVRWRNRTAAVPAVAVGGDRVWAAGGEVVVGLDRATGQERARLAARWVTLGPAPLPPLVAVDDGLAFIEGDRLTATVAAPAGEPTAAVVAACSDDRRYLVAWRDGQLARWDLDGGAATVRWSVASPQPRRVDCGAAPLLVVATHEVRSIDPVTGVVVGGPIVADDGWVDPMDPTRVELATVAGVEHRDRALGPPTTVVTVTATRLLAARGTRRVLGGGDGDPIALDRDTVWVLAAPGGQAVIALGDRAMLAGPWRWPRVSLAQQPTRYAWPITAPTPPRLVAPAVTLVPDPPLVDVPAAMTAGLGVVGDPEVQLVGATLLDPDDGERLYAVALTGRPDDHRGAGVAAFDLHVDRFRWLARGGCPPGQPIAIAVTVGRIACGARGDGLGHGAVQVIAADDGRPVWSWRGATVDAIVGGAGVFAIVAGAEAIVVDAITGVELARWRTSDGYVPRLAIVGRAGDARVACLERGAVVIRSRALGWLPIAATAIDGAAQALLVIDGRLAVALGDGSLYVLADDGRAVAAGALASSWLPRGAHAVTLTTTARGDGGVTAIDATGVVRTSAALAQLRLAAIGARGADADAPFALTTVDGELIGLDVGGRAAVRVALPDLQTPTFATVVDGHPVVGAVLASPLRVVTYGW